MTSVSDTAGPSDRAGLVAELLAEPSHVHRVTSDTELMHRAAEAIAALSRAPEAEE